MQTYTYKSGHKSDKAYDDRDKLSKKDILKNTLEEARTILPGVQAMFGFQLIAVFNKPFYDLTFTDQVVHLAALCFSTLAGCFLMAPAAYHRIAETDTVSDELVMYSTRMICAAMMPLAASLSMDIYVILKLISKETIGSVILAAIIFSFVNFFWFVIPLRAREKRRPIQPEA